MSASPLHAAGMRLSGLKRFGTPEQIAQAEADVAALRLERYIDEALAKGVDRPTRQRLAMALVTGGAE